VKNLKAVKLKREGNLLTKKNKRRILLLKDDDKKNENTRPERGETFLPSLFLSLSLYSIF